MPMGIDRSPTNGGASSEPNWWTRRRLLHAGLAATAGAAAAIAAPARAALASASSAVRMSLGWNVSDQSWAGIWRLRTGKEGASWVVEQAIATPQRIHESLALPDGRVLYIARRPGDFLLLVGRAGREREDWLWQSGSHSFNGHAVLTPNGCLLTAETAYETGLGELVVRQIKPRHAMQDWPVLYRWPTGAIDLHDLLLDPQDHRIVYVAVGGVTTAPETGRSKAAGPLASCLLRVDWQTSQLLERWQLPDPWLSIRHLAALQVADAGVHSTHAQTLAIALQSEHPDAQIRQQAPLLALLSSPQSPTNQRQLALQSTPAEKGYGGYGGDILALPHSSDTSPRLLLSATRGHRCLQWPSSNFNAAPEPSLQSPGALAKDRQGGVWVGSHYTTAYWKTNHWQTAALPKPNIRIDNHWAVV